MAKEKFAKLFERDGEQVLVRREDNRKGDPAVFIMFDAGFATVTVDFGFADTDDGRKARDTMFDVMDEDNAFGAARRVMNQIGAKEE